MSDHPIIGKQVHTVEAWIPVSAELLKGTLRMDKVHRMMSGELTDEERAEAQRRREEREAEQRRQVEQHAQLLTSTTGVQRAVLELHGPVDESGYGWPVCQGCDASGYEWEPPEWPCRTYVLARDVQDAS